MKAKPTIKKDKKVILSKEEKDLRNAIEDINKYTTRLLNTKSSKVDVVEENVIYELSKKLAKIFFLLDENNLGLGFHSLKNQTFDKEVSSIISNGYIVKREEVIKDKNKII